MIGTGQVRLTGTMSCPPGRCDAVRAALPAHIRLTRAEPGCLSFDVTETTPGTFGVAECFASRAAFDHHQARAAASEWAQITQGLPRDYRIEEG
ncbi:antibiotic biosynthesis monooxygenase [Pseudooceanicola sediminis]|uniref:Antibiotic biosynthesis monooxygenase n=1 Tax=Pseudooceanicola sediminis TaxID=2211117 RepID=A0A399J6I7_9RHOB|nr:antibiotic biosynthesis monooxygenase [Pseudooceanicola sediminis]KAA2317249.1 antibiotic biosynthesis monooxygenase [Puniceibacterium sp. HSS470]RII39602.1 antibiotic biosynthesis monooxygenase [Pseudooceanicola sediminis]|tara:strand:- start:1209 stop:1490 length:282 start_codon:yes stop_codon:yes gene_type:complete